jgi:hypothetical protein
VFFPQVAEQPAKGDIASSTVHDVKIYYSGSPKIQVTQNGNVIVTNNSYVTTTRASNINAIFDCSVKSITNENPWFGRVLQLDVYVNNIKYMELRHNFVSWTNAELRTNFKLSDL